MMRQNQSTVTCMAFVAGVALMLPQLLSGQQGSRPQVIAFVTGDSVSLESMHSTTTSAEGLTISGHAFRSSASDLAHRELAELVVAPSGFVGIISNHPADSIWVTPVLGGERQPSSVIEAGFQAPSVPGRYEFLVSGSWAAHPDGTRPPAGPAYQGTWGLRLIVREHQ